MLLDPALFPLAKIEPEQFSSPLLGRAFRLLRDRHDRELSVQLPALAGVFTSEEMSHLVEAASQPESLAHGARAMTDYIKTIGDEARLRQAPKSADALLELRQRQREKKTMEDGQ